MSNETIKIKSTDTHIRHGELLYNNIYLNIMFVIKKYIDGIEPSSNDIKEIKRIFKSSGIRDIKKSNIIKKGNDFYIIDFLL